MMRAVVAIAVVTAPSIALADPLYEVGPDAPVLLPAGQRPRRPRLDPKIWASSRIFGGAFVGAGLGAAMSVDDVRSPDDGLVGGVGASAGYEHPLVHWFALRGFLRYTRWNTEWAQAIGYDGADAFDIDAAARFRLYLRPRFAFTASVPFGLTLSHVPTNVRRTGYTEATSLAAGYNFGALGGIEVLLGPGDIGLTVEAGLRRHDVTHTFEYASTDGSPAPPSESIRYELGWAVLEAGVTIPL